MAMELIRNRAFASKQVRAVVLDFDGTVSTLRTGWEGVMRALMLEWLSAGKTPDAALCQRVDAYINESTGIQTIYQMQWLAAEIAAAGKLPDAPDDPWYYKQLYNDRLMQTVAEHREDVRQGRRPREDYLIVGAEPFLAALQRRGVRLCVASGTDHPDVVAEAEVLGVSRYFSVIAGAPPHEANCSKEAVLRRLIGEEQLSGDEVAVIGDGKVEIGLGAGVGARTIGLATDERLRHGVSPVKRERLVKAGADIIAGDFTERGALLGFLGFAEE